MTSAAEQRAIRDAVDHGPILIWGAGAIGGTLGVWWARAGHDVLLVDTAAEHVEACRSTGLEIFGPVDEFTQRIPAVTPAELTGTYSRIVLAVKAQATLPLADGRPIGRWPGLRATQAIYSFRVR